MSNFKLLTMKKYIFIILVFFFAFTKNAKAQVPDTLAYLQTIVANKANYIGQPFSVLANSLQIQIKYFFPYASIHHNKNKETSTSIAFYFPVTVNELYLTYPGLEICWQPYLNMHESNIIRQTNTNRGQWNAAAAALYSTAIIADIRLEN